MLVHYGSAAAEAEAVVEEIRAQGGRAQALGAARWLSGEALRVTAAQSSERILFEDENY